VDLLSDFKREVSRLYGTLLEEPYLSRRAYFLVDREGVLRWSHVEAELGHRRPNEELLAQLAAVGRGRPGSPSPSLGIIRPPVAM
jgi:alkyl hydroperoxide reductase subunit AhpC